MRLEVGEQQLALIGEVGERLHPVADRVAGRLVAGDDEQDEERAELLRGELVAVDLGGHHHRRDVVLRVGATVLPERLGVHEHLEGVRHEIFERAAELGIADAEDRVGPLEDPGVVLGRDAHHVADDLEGQRRGDVLDEVALLVGELLEQAVDDRRPP